MTEDDGRRFEWHQAKADANLRKHGIPFEAAEAVFDDPHKLEEDGRFAEGEYRSIVIGMVDGLVVAVVFSEPEEHLVRIISARLATAAERKAHEQNLFQL